MAQDGDSAELPDCLPVRSRRDRPTQDLERRTQALFGDAAMEALLDIVRDEKSPDASEFRFAVLRGSVEDAYFWFHKEWSFRAKERFRPEVLQRQGGRCACCGKSGMKLELNHRRKVRDFGPTRATNLEALCALCHASIDRRGIRCHEPSMSGMDGHAS
jgi:predicted restriction endonuclease